MIDFEPTALWRKRLNLYQLFSLLAFSHLSKILNQWFISWPNLSLYVIGSVWLLVVPIVRHAGHVTPPQIIYREYNARAQQCALRPPKLDSSIIKYDEATTLRLASRPSGWNCVLYWKKPDAELKEVVSAPPAALHQLGWQITRPGGWCRALDFAADTKCWTKRHFKTKTAAVISKAEMGGLEFRHSRIAIFRVKQV